MSSLLGFDIGSSSVKAALIDAATGRLLASATSPDRELPIHAAQPGWAEQHPDTWWEHALACAGKLRAQQPKAWAAVHAIGISYQMHGLVAVDKLGRPLRPAIIWCDSRAVAIGAECAERIGRERCLERLLNLPGNFTASKLAWVKQYEPDVYGQIDKIMLPGDYLALRLTGEAVTTPSGLSEGILWDYKSQGLARDVMDAYGFPEDLIPRLVPTCAIQGRLSSAAAAEFDLPLGTPIAYRAGDQPNNALSLNVLRPGELATTAGTSGVVYGVTDRENFDPPCRVNTFVHVSHTEAEPRYGVLLCVNGVGILNSWLKRQLAEGLSYDEMNSLASDVPPGAQGLSILPFGNGAERMLGNRDIGASLHGLNFNVHGRGHLLRAAQEGIAFALNTGIDVMRGLGLRIETVRAGRANMFLSPLFREVFATLTGARVELYNTDGAQGAARGAGIGVGIYKSFEDAFAGLEVLETVEPTPARRAAYREAYERWSERLKQSLGGD